VTWKTTSLALFNMQDYTIEYNEYNRTHTISSILAYQGRTYGFLNTHVPGPINYIVGGVREKILIFLISKWAF